MVKSMKIKKSLISIRVFIEYPDCVQPHSAGVVPFKCRSNPSTPVIQLQCTHCSSTESAGALFRGTNSTNSNTLSIAMNAIQMPMGHT